MPDQERRPSAPDKETDIVRLRNLGFGYSGRPSVLRDVNLILPHGSFHFLTGPSGAGKSTLLRLLTLDERPISGRIGLFGQDVTHIPRTAIPSLRRRIGMVFQDFRLLDHLSAFDNVALPLRLNGEKPREYAQDVAEMLRWVGLGGRFDALPPSLSGGEKQRLAIARAVITRPRLILADEPTGSVDRDMGEKLMRLFLSLNKLGATVLIATHDDEMAGRYGAGRLHLENGQLHQVQPQSAFSTGNVA
ncbi:MULTISPECIES: cell division ATP-binding protein FtsE [unclassified Brevundimonas]|uniref:cell division ATP-binding protein FtsE n=1 Tax=unclassified Brevundimonas TaxID=2622653 RepID=UPI0025C47051|nr:MULTISPECIES: ATP-binding cassette domain-containing protein [unclassified Brevundimonas]